MRFKAQHNIMQYVILTAFVIIIIMALIFFLTGWYISQLGIEKTKIYSDRALFLSKNLINGPYLIKEKGMFDDSKLRAVKALESSEFCKDLEKIFGTDFFFEINVLDGCLHCSYEVCTKPNRKNVSYVLPVNVYEMETGFVYPAVLRAGIYYD